MPSGNPFVDPGNDLAPGQNVSTSAAFFGEAPAAPFSDAMQARSEALVSVDLGVKSAAEQPQDMKVAFEGASQHSIRALETEPGDSAPSGANQASWPEAAYHTVTAVVGAGVLGLPHAFSYLGWVGGPLALTLAMTTSLYTSWLMATMHELGGKRINRYRDLGSAVLGPRLGPWAIIPFQFTVMVGLGVTYTVTGAKSMHLIEELYNGDKGANLTKYVFIFAAAQLALSQIRDFASLWWVSIVGALMAIGYSVLGGILAMAAASSDGFEPSFAARAEGWELWRMVFSSLGAVTFAYGGHSVLLEIQATLRAPPPPRDNMMKGVYCAYVVSGVCYYFVAIAGYASYGNGVDDDVLLSRPRINRGWIVAANVMVVLHVLASYQVYSHPVFEVVESTVAAASTAVTARSREFRLAWRSTYVLLTAIVAASLPFFSDLMGLIGAIGFTPMTFVVPSALWLVAMRNRPLWETVLNWTIVVVFSVVGVLAFVASVSLIASKASTYEFWS